jgi:hypothetical protein
MYKDLLIWGESPKEIPPVKHGISRRFTNVICDYLAKGLTPPGMFEYAPNWEKEWEKMQKSSAINGGSSCPTDSKSDSKKAEVY